MVLQTTLVLIVVALSCAQALLWAATRRARKLLAPLNHWYKGIPLLGNAHQILGDAKFFLAKIMEFSDALEDSAKPLLFWIGPVPLMIFSDPDTVKTVCNAFADKPYFYDFAKRYVGEGLVTAPGAIWKRNIKKLSGAFTGSVVNGFQAIFNTQAEKFVQKLKSEVNAPPFDVKKKYIVFTTLESICQTAFGIPGKADSYIVTKDYHDHFVRTFQLLVARGGNPFVHPDFMYNLTPAHREFKRSVAVLHKFSDSILARRKIERMELKKKECAKSDEKPRPKFKAFLDILLDLSEEDPTFNDLQIRSEIDTIIVGGHETVSSTLTMILIYLGSRSDIQEKLYNEMRDIFGESKRPVEKDDLAQMRYCEALIYETLRMYPPFPFVMRNADRDLPMDDYTIPKGTVCGIHTWSAGRSKKTWGPDADQFRPERWLEDNCPPSPATFLSFSYGKRACIGKRYAVSLLKTVLAHCARELVVASKLEDLELKADVSLVVCKGQYITVKPRE